MGWGVRAKFRGSSTQHHHPAPLAGAGTSRMGDKTGFKLNVLWGGRDAANACLSVGRESGTRRSPRGDMRSLCSRNSCQTLTGPVYQRDFLRGCRVSVTCPPSSRGAAPHHKHRAANGTAPREAKGGLEIAPFPLFFLKLSLFLPWSSRAHPCDVQKSLRVSAQEGF